MGPFSPQTVFLLCGDLQLDLGTVRERLRRFLPTAAVQIIPGLCEHPEGVRRAAAGPLVLGLCHPPSNLGAFQTEARKIGLDPLGVEIRVLQPGKGADVVERAVLQLLGAAARAHVYPGSHPEQVRPCFPEALSRRTLLRLAFLYYEAIPSVDVERCAADQGCQVCRTVCPHGAWQWVDGRPELDRTACQVCGRCITACPRGAIANPTCTAEQLEAEIRTLLDPSLGALESRGLVYVCRRTDPRTPQGHPAWLPVALPCVGMIPPTWLLAPLLLGAGAVRVLPCPRGCPHGMESQVEGVIRFCQRLLQALGLPEDLVGPGGPLDVPPPPARWSIGDGGLFSSQAATGTLQRLAEAVGGPALRVSHPFAPLGQVTIDPEACTGCLRCAEACPTGALGSEEGERDLRLTFDPARCPACEQCLLACPEREHGAIKVLRVLDLAMLKEGRRTLHRVEIRRCSACGGRVASTALLGRIAQGLGPEEAPLMRYLQQYCPSCRRELMPFTG